jgi:hypothetical protein
MPYDVDVRDGRVAHRHVDHVRYATVERRTLAPADGEAATGAWTW